MGIIEKENVFIGADSAISYGDTQTTEPQVKIFRRDGFLIAGAGTIRQIQLMKYVFSPPPIEKQENPMQYMVGKFIPTLKASLRSSGELHKESEQERWDSCALVAFDKQLFEISCNFTVTSPHAGYTSIGSAYQIALGILYATTNKRARERIELALGGAEKLTHYVQKPFQIEKL